MAPALQDIGHTGMDPESGTRSGCQEWSRELRTCTQDIKWCTFAFIGCHHVRRGELAKVGQLPFSGTCPWTKALTLCIDRIPQILFTRFHGKAMKGSEGTLSRVSDVPACRSTPQAMKAGLRG